MNFLNIMDYGMKFMKPNQTFQSLSYKFSLVLSLQFIPFILIKINLCSWIKWITAQFW